MTAEDSPASNAGHRSRLRKRFTECGLGALHDYEALELLLTYAIPRRDVKPLAKLLLSRFGSFAAVFDATEYELREVPGVGDNAGALILLAKAICARYLERKAQALETIARSEDVADFVRLKIGGGGKESFMVLYLNTRKKLLDYSCIPGTVDQATVFPREVIEQCLHCKAKSIIVAHNHPSGYCQPSDEDVLLTRKLRVAADAHDIEFLDHLIVSASEFFSMRAAGYIV